MTTSGIVFGATGRLYRNLARRAAHTVKHHMPEVQIDLFTGSRPMQDPVFDRIVHLENAQTTRPKFEALLRSRFDRTLYLDADIVMCAPVWDLFELLEQFDIVGGHEQYGSSSAAMRNGPRPLPPAFRQLNSGVLAIRKSDRSQSFLNGWRDAYVAANARYDQPFMRDQLWQTDLRLWVLPPEYNQMYTPHVLHSSDMHAAPRLLHLTHLHDDKKFGLPADRPFDLADLIPGPTHQRLLDLLHSDQSLGNPPPPAPTLREKLKGKSPSALLASRLRLLRQRFR